MQREKLLLPLRLLLLLLPPLLVRSQKRLGLPLLPLAQEDVVVASESGPLEKKKKETHSLTRVIFLIVLNPIIYYCASTGYCTTTALISSSSRSIFMGLKRAISLSEANCSATTTASCSDSATADASLHATATASGSRIAHQCNASIEGCRLLRWRAL